MFNRECSYCAKLFDCNGKTDETKDCLNFQINPSRAEMYREYCEEEASKVAMRRK